MDNDIEARKVIKKITGITYEFFDACLKKSSKEDYWLKCVKFLIIYFNTDYYNIINQIGFERTKISSKNTNQFFTAFFISLFSPIISFFIACFIPTSKVDLDQAMFVFEYAIYICLFIIIVTIIISIIISIVRYKRYKEKFNTLVDYYIEESKNFQLTDEIIQRTINAIPEFEYIYKKVKINNNNINEFNSKLF